MSPSMEIATKGVSMIPRNSAVAAGHRLELLLTQGYIARLVAARCTCHVIDSAAAYAGGWVVGRPAQCQHGVHATL